MFKKILVAEDIDSMGLGLDTTLKQLPNVEIVHAKYCDDAILKIKRALLDAVPFDLLITDLSFVADHRDTILANGEDLIEAVKKLQPEMKVIVYSIEDRTYKIKSLLQDLDIDGYVGKGRESTSEVMRAIDAVYATEGKYISPKFQHILSDKNLIEIEEYDIDLIRYLSEGLLIKEISGILTSQNKAAKSESSIEKRINLLKIYFKAKNNVHLVSIAKDLGLI